MAASPFMASALEAAHRVRGFTSPNPGVGAALVLNGRVVAAGATAPYPGAHAEAQVLEDGIFPGGELYVTLEPCVAFLGKRTPPCADAIIRARIRRVVIALPDPDPGVAGRGIEVLRAAGIQVEVGDGADEARQQLRPYIKHRTTGLPYVIAKFAASLDGRTATANGDSKWITGPLARDRGHQERAVVDAIMVGSGTVLADDPALTARPGGVLTPHQPVRVVLDARGRTPPTAQLFSQPGISIIATTRAAAPAWKAAIQQAGGTLLECEEGETGVNLQQLMQVLARRSILSIWAEGGATLLGSLFDEQLVDEAWAFIAPKLLGGSARPAVGGYGVDYVADAPALRDVRVEQLGPDVLIRGYCGSFEPA